MKYFIAFVLMAAGNYTAFAQSDTVFITTHSLALQQVNGSGGPLNPAPPLTSIPEGVKFTKTHIVTSGNTSDYVIAIWQWNEKHEHIKPDIKKKNKVKNRLYVYNENNHPGDKEQTYFLLLHGDVAANTAVSQPTPSRWSFSYLNITSLPAKLRFGSNKILHYPDDNVPYQRRFDVGSGINLGYAFGFQYQAGKSRDVNIKFLCGLSAGSVNIDSSSTDNKCGTAKNTTAVTPYGGLIVEYKTFQIGTFIGGDYALGEIGRNWIYQGKPWIGFGIGISIFSGIANNATQQTGPLNNGNN